MKDVSEMTREEIASLPESQLHQAVFRRVTKELNKLPPELRVSLAQTLYYSEVYAHLINTQESHIDEQKEWLKLNAQLQMARIVSMIESFPDVDKSEYYRDKSHKEFVKWTVKRRND